MDGIVTLIVRISIKSYCAVICNKTHNTFNIQEEYTNGKNEDDDDCISLFAESFDTNL